MIRYWQHLISIFKSSDRGLTCSINLHYFNSSSARQLMEILNHLDSEAKKGRPVQVEWCCVSDDDIMIERRYRIRSHGIAVSYQNDCNDRPIIICINDAIRRMGWKQN